MDRQEGYERARVLKAELKDHVFSSPDYIVNVRPTLKGGPVVGWNWTGNFRIEVEANCYETASGIPPKKIWYSPDTDGGAIRKAERYYNKIQDEFSMFSEGCKMVWIYRKSGLIPKKIAKRHSANLKKSFGSNEIRRDPKIQNTLIMKMMIPYLSKFAKCPDCGKRGFTLTILGWTCKHCQSYLYDIGDKLTWEKDNQAPY